MKFLLQYTKRKHIIIFLVSFLQMHNFILIMRKYKSTPN